MLTLSVGAETKPKRLRSRSQLLPPRQRLEFRTISNSFSPLVRITENDHGLKITKEALGPAGDYCSHNIWRMPKAIHRGRAKCRNRAPGVHQQQLPFSVCLLIPQRKRKRRVKNASAQTVAKMFRLLHLWKNSASCQLASRSMQAGGLHYSFVGWAASCRA